MASTRLPADALGFLNELKAEKVPKTDAYAAGLRLLWCAPLALRRLALKGEMPEIRRWLAGTSCRELLVEVQNLLEGAAQEAQRVFADTDKEDDGKAQPA